MSARRVIAITAGLGGLIGGLIYLSTAPPPAASPTAAPAVTATPATEPTAALAVAGPLRWPEGYTQRFQIVYRDESLVHPQPDQDFALRGLAAWSGTLHLTPDRDARGDHLRAHLSDVQVERFQIMGQDRPQALWPLEGAQARITLDADGGLGEAQIAAGVDEIAGRVLAALLAQLQLQLQPGQGRWQATHRDALGDGAVRYTATEGAGRWSLRRSRQGYEAINLAPSLLGEIQRAESEGALHADAEGRLQRLHEAAKLQILDAQDRPLAAASLTLTLQRLGQDPAAALAAVTWADAAEGQAPRPADQRLRERVGDLTLEAVLDALPHRAGAETLPDHPRWLWRAVGLLRLHPALCGELVDRVLAADHGFESSRLALDLLASAGHGEAQAAMIRLLEASSHGGADRHRMVQSFLMVERPTTEAAQFLARTYAAGGDGALAAANALGGVAARLHDHGEPAAAAQAVAQLKAGWAAASDEGARYGHVVALGNTGHPEALPALSSASADAIPSIRQAAARGLSRLDSAEATEALQGLLGDESPLVVAEAVRGLAARGETLVGLADALGDGPVPLATARALISAAEIGRLPDAQQWMSQVARSPLPRRWVERATRLSH